MEWQPIETAPRNGTDILAYERIADTDRILTMRYDGVAQAFVTNVHSFVAFEPTHWMPLPAPPITQKPEIPEGFTKWEGGEWPHDPDAWVMIVFRNGDVWRIPHQVGSLHWSHEGYEDDVIAYRIVEKAKL